MIYLGKKYILQKQNYILTIILLLSVVTIYSYFSYTGAARLQIALQGYIVEAYNTGLEELKYYKEPNSKKYIPIQTIPKNNEDMGIIQVNNHFGIKIGSYYSY